MQFMPILSCMCMLNNLYRTIDVIKIDRVTMSLVKTEAKTLLDHTIFLVFSLDQERNLLYGKIDSSGVIRQVTLEDSSGIKTQYSVL